MTPIPHSRPLVRDTYRVLVIRDSGKWVAQVLEYDVGAQADDLETLRVRLLCALQAEDLDNIGAAPDRWFALWDKS